MSNKFTKKAQSVLTLCQSYACELGHTYIGSEHLLLALAGEGDCIAARLLSARGIHHARVRESIISMTGVGAPSHVTPEDMTPRLRTVIENAARTAASAPQAFVGTEHLLHALCNESDSVGVRMIESLGASPGDLILDCNAFINGGKSRGKERQAKEKHEGALAGYGKNLTEAAKSGKPDPVIGRDSETARLIQILSRKQKNNPCLIGEPGVGKTAVVEGLAQRIVAGEVPENLTGKQIISLDIAAMIAGAKYRGEFEERFKAVLSRAAADPCVVLFIDEIHTIIGAGAAEGAVDAANIIKPALARGELQVIGATTLSEYRRYIEKDAALERRFQSVLIREPDDAQALQILEGLRPCYQEHHDLTISDSALQAAVTMSRRYITDRFLPDKAIDLMDEAAARLRLTLCKASPEKKQAERELAELCAQKEAAICEQDFTLAAHLHEKERQVRGRLDALSTAYNSGTGHATPTVTEKEIAEVVTEWTGIPISGLLRSERERLLSLEQALCERVIGQETAARAVASAIRRGRTGLKEARRPIGSFIFLGHTGVGKTQMCRALADALFGSESAMIRLDMSEYMEKHSVSKLIGAPPGYVGYEMGGGLTERVRRAPYSLVLFDEIEKAHPDVFFLLLQVLDDGVLTDSQGRRVDFSNTVVVMTSNAGAGKKGHTIGFQSGREAAADAMRQALFSLFPPEFLGRVDKIVVFEDLTREHALRIAGIALEELAQRAAAIGISLHVSPEVAEHVTALGYAPEKGARELRRVVAEQVEDALATAILDGSVSKGTQVQVKISNGKVVFAKNDTARRQE